VTVNWTDGDDAARENEDTDGWDFNTPTTEVDRFVTVSDESDLFGTVDLTEGTPLDAHDYAEDDVIPFTYTKDFAWADYGADRCGDYTYNNEATIVETEQSASATLLVNVQCYVYETAYAKGDGASAITTTCFIPTFSRWGWTNLIGPGSYEWDLWAAAGQCDTDKGTWVGTVVVDYDEDGYVTVTFHVDAPYLLDETHVYVGTAQYPKDKKGKSTVAPGQYTNASPFNGDPVYVIAHAVVGIPDPDFGP